MMGNDFYYQLPLDSSLRLWLDSSRVNGVGVALPSDAALLPMWKDISGNCNDVAQITAGNQPVFKVNIQNGLGAVNYARSTDWLETTITKNFPTSNMYIATVTKVSSAPKVFYHFSIGGASCYFYVDSGLKTNSQSPLSSSSTTTMAGASGATWANGTNIIEHFWQAGAGQSVSVNAGTAANVAMATTGNITLPVPLAIGNFIGGGIYSPSYMMEVMMYCRYPTAAERTIIRNYLNAKWAVY